MAKKARIGDIIEIKTKRGLAYAQFYQYHSTRPKFGALLRVLPGIFRECPTDLKELVAQKELFSVFFPLQAALKSENFRIVTQAEVPPHAVNFPLFRCGTRNPATGIVSQWWLWDGVKTWKVGSLTDEQLDLPIQQICNDLALIQRIEQGWTPRKAEMLMQSARLKHQIAKNPSARMVRHFLLFTNKGQAEQAKQKATDAGFISAMLETGSGVCVAAEQSAPITEEYVENAVVLLSEIAQSIGGTYDAWETEV